MPVSIWVHASQRTLTLHLPYGGREDFEALTEAIAGCVDRHRSFHLVAGRVQDKDEAGEKNGTDGA
jgi:hypothetical protein